MSTELRKEFEGFVSELTIDICKEVLVNDISKINKDFKCYSAEHLKQLQEFKAIEKIFKSQTNTFIQMNKSIERYVSSIEIQNKNIESALKIVNTDHKVMLNDVMVKNDKSLKNYEIQVAAFNKKEKEILICDFKQEMNSTLTKAVAEIKAENNTAKLVELNNKLGSQGTKIDKMLTEQDKSNKELISIYNNISALTGTAKKNNTKIIEGNIKNIEISNEIADLKTDVKEHKKIVLGLMVVIIFLAIIILFKVF